LDIDFGQCTRRRGEGKIRESIVIELTAADIGKRVVQTDGRLVA